MVGNDADTNNSPSQNNNANSFAEYLTRASQAHKSGDVVLSLHLYLAAYERSLQDSSTPDASVIDGLRQAWNLACEHKERSLAEYIFEKLEPYLSPDEITRYAGMLQRLALEKLEEFGLSREDLEDMTEMISQDFLGLDPNSLLMRIERGVSSSDMFGAIQRGLVRGRDEKNTEESRERADKKSLEQFSETINRKASEKSELSFEKDSVSKTEIASSSDAAQTLMREGALQSEATQGKETQNKASSHANDVDQDKPSSHSHDENKDKARGHSHDADQDNVSAHNDQAPQNLNAFGGLGGMLPIDGAPSLFTLPNIGLLNSDRNTQGSERTTYRDLVGFDRAIENMRAFGIGMEDDPEYQKLVATLNEQHGLTRTPITESFLFRAPVREDANQFMLATMGELGLPVIRMRMEENLQGLPVLCVMASADNSPRLNARKNAIEGRGVLVLEDVDLWGTPIMEAGNDEMSGFAYAQLSRGAREAMNLIRSAIENPDVFVLMSSSSDTSIDNFFLGFLEPLTVVDIEYPSASERADLWANIVKEHPSLKSIDRGLLVKYSSNMSRFDIYMAAREAVEEAYKASLIAKEYVPVDPENVFEKIAAYQPLESEEYHQLENAVVDMFRSDLKNLDDLLKGTSE